MRQTSGSAVAVFLTIWASYSCSTQAFVVLPFAGDSSDNHIASSSSSSRRTKHFSTGGWGIGPQRDLTPEEFAKGGDRPAFEGYQLRDRGEFMRQVARDKQDLERGEIDELLAVAKQAGIQVKDPAERLNKFDLDDEDDDDLDLSVQFDEEIDDVENRKNEDSITRFDEDTGASGVW